MKCPKCGSEMYRSMGTGAALLTEFAWHNSCDICYAEWTDWQQSLIDTQAARIKELEAEVYNLGSCKVMVENALNESVEECKLLRHAVAITKHEGAKAAVEALMQLHKKNEELEARLAQSMKHNLIGIVHAVADTQVAHSSEEFEKLEARLKDAEECLGAVYNEVSGVVSLDEWGLREVIGNTNVSVLKFQLDKARAYFDRKASEGKERE